MSTGKVGPTTLIETSAPDKREPSEDGLLASGKKVKYRPERGDAPLLESGIRPRTTDGREPHCTAGTVIKTILVVLPILIGAAGVYTYVCGPVTLPGLGILSQINGFHIAVVGFSAGFVLLTLFAIHSCLNCKSEATADGTAIDLRAPRTCCDLGEELSETEEKEPATEGKEKPEHKEEGEKPGKIEKKEGGKGGKEKPGDKDTKEIDGSEGSGVKDKKETDSEEEGSEVETPLKREKKGKGANTRTDTSKKNPKKDVDTGGTKSDSE